MVKKAFSRGNLILADMDGHDFNMPANSDTVIRNFAWRSHAVHLISMCFHVKKEKNNKKKKKCKKVYRKLERTIYAKGEPKEREREKIQKVDWKPERAIYAKESKRKSVKEPTRLKTQMGDLGKN